MLNLTNGYNYYYDGDDANFVFQAKEVERKGKERKMYREPLFLLFQLVRSLAERLAPLTRCSVQCAAALFEAPYVSK